MMTVYRKIIVFLDWLIVRCIIWRMKVVLLIEKEKRKNNLPISFPKVEQEKLLALRKMAQKKKISPKLVEEVFRAIIKEAVFIQEKQRKRG